MDGIEIRRAFADDEAAVAACVDAAYTKYIVRIGCKPGPMLADYRDLIGRRQVWVATEHTDLRGVLVLVPASDHLLIWNVAVHPKFQGRGLGRKLMTFAEEHAVGLGLREMRLFTHELMSENIALYRRLGYEESERRTEGDHRRVYMRKTI